MTVRFESTVKRWNGLSTDVKPTEDVPEGSTFHAVDTGELFIYHDGMWEVDLRQIHAMQAV